MKKTAMALVLVCAAAGGCRSGSNVTVVKDPGPGQRARATELAVQAQRAQKAGQTDKAIELYQKALAESQDLSLVWNNLGLLYMDKQNYIDAAEMFKYAADLEPRDPRPHYNIGVIYQRQGYPEDALDYFGRSLKRDPRYLPSLRGAVTMAKLMDRSDDESLERVRTAIMLERNPQWREIFERESLRIRGTLGKGEPQMVPVDAPQGDLERRWRELQQGPRLEPDPGPAKPAEPQPQTPEQPAPQPTPEPVGGGPGVGTEQQPTP